MLAPQISDDLRDGILISESRRHPVYEGVSDPVQGRKHENIALPPSSDEIKNMLDGLFVLQRATANLYYFHLFASMFCMFSVM